MRSYEGTAIKLEAYKRGGYYILRIRTYTSWMAATRYHNKYVAESGWTTPHEIKFEAPAEKERANRYFKAVKKSHPDMELIADEPNTYMAYDYDSGEWHKKTY